VAEILKYLKKKTSLVVAVQLDLEIDSFTYQKWGGTLTRWFRCQALKGRTHAHSTHDSLPCHHLLLDDS